MNQIKAFGVDQTEWIDYDLDELTIGFRSRLPDACGNKKTVPTKTTRALYGVH